METGVNGEIWAMLDSQGTELAELTLIGQKNEGISSNVNTVPTWEQTFILK